VAAVYTRIHHAIEQPMKSYAKLEGPAAAAAARTEAPWPFETGHWPPAYVPSLQPQASLPQDAVSNAQVAYTGVSQSADQISAPMPPAAGALGGIGDVSSPLNHLLKTLFG
jgi:hypothetical protein